VKRHPALAELSRDHHHALVVARALKRAEGETAEDARVRFLEYWRKDGAEHFREEEEILLPTYAAYADPDHPVISRVLIDHVRIRRLASELSEASPPAEFMQQLGRELEQHVRREERELFSLIEQAMPDEELRHLAALLST
jgi:iron-sulfur cluster repair protein YtfE (RIC family)